jgi:catechol 2,3-dioxygenase-like lactoylglutathione lyase family enzyme
MPRCSRASWSRMLGSFLEVSLGAPDIRRAYEFWTRLGFASAVTGDIRAWPYGVMVGGGLALGLHGRVQPGPAATFVRENVAGLLRQLPAGVVPVSAQVDPDVFNELALEDPAGLPVQVIEARTFSPPGPGGAPPLTGRFLCLSQPAADTDAAAAFWRELGYTTRDEDAGWPALRLAELPLGWHAPRVAPEPVLLFRHPDLPTLRARLAAEGIAEAGRLARALAGDRVLLRDPSGQLLAMLA